MIGFGLKKLAKQHNMTVSNGIAYGNMLGYATTMGEGSGFKRLDITIRFPQEGLKEQFMARVNSVDVRREFLVQSINVGNRQITVVFQDTVGTMKKIEAFIAWFYPILTEFGALGANACLDCGSIAPDGGWYLVNGVACYLHGSCAQRIESQMKENNDRRVEEKTGSYLQGTLGAFVGAALGAVVWAVVLYLGYVASIIGLLIGWLAEKGYTLLHGKQGKAKLVILIFAIVFGVLLGTILPDVVVLCQMIGNGELPGCSYGEIPSLIITVMQADAEYMSAVVSNAGMGLVFAALGVFALLRKTNAEVSGDKIKKLK